MNLDQLLHETLTDERLALPVPPGTLDRVRRRRRTRQRLVVTGTSVVVLATVGAALALLPGGSTGRAVVASTPPATTGCDASPAGRLPGSSYVVSRARDWFMTKPQSDAFFHTYVQPSPDPADSVPSPQPSGPQTDRLVAAMTAAGVPGAAGLGRDEATGGDRRSIQLEGVLADGRDLLVARTQATYPFTTSGYYASDTEDSSPDVVIQDVPGTGCAGLLLAEKPGATNSSLVQVVAPDGLSTGWSSRSVPLSQLKQWAYAVAAWETAHPTG